MKNFIFCIVILLSSIGFAQDKSLEDKISHSLHLNKSQKSKLSKILKLEKNKLKLADVICEDEFYQDVREIDSKHLDPDLNLELIKSLKLTSKQKSKLYSMVEKHIKILEKNRNLYYKNIRDMLDDDQKNIFDKFILKD